MADPQYTDCYTCSQTESNYMCSGIYLAEQQSNYIACCASGDTSTNCVSSSSNKCSPTFTQAKYSFFSYCPNINYASCGLSESQGVTSQYLNPLKNNLKSTISATQSPMQSSTYSACYWVIKNQLFEYQNGNIYVEFTRIDSDVNIHINGGSDINNAS